jgi:hypothetical protein
MRFGMPYCTSEFQLGLSNVIDRYCIEVPLAGQRPFEGGDISLFNLLLKTDNKGASSFDYEPLSRLTYV